jgi:hypothetical protein
MGENNAYRVLVKKKTEGNRQVGRPRRRWEDNIKMGFRKAGLGGVYWIHLAYDREQWRAPMNTTVKSSISIEKFFSCSTTAGISRRTQLHEVRL